jgi:hypothetical protein
MALEANNLKPIVSLLKDISILADWYQWIKCIWYLYESLLFLSNVVEWIIVIEIIFNISKDQNEYCW